MKLNRKLAAEADEAVSGVKAAASPVVTKVAASFLFSFMGTLPGEVASTEPTAPAGSATRLRVRRDVRPQLTQK
jgi:hypothetical protein